MPELGASTFLVNALGHCNGIMALVALRLYCTFLAIQGPVDNAAFRLEFLDLSQAISFLENNPMSSEVAVVTCPFFFAMSVFAMSVFAFCVLLN
jgi:hypothetical protein